MGNNRYGCYPLDVIGAVAATILMVRLSDKIGKSRVGEYLAWMGRNSMVLIEALAHIGQVDIINFCDKKISKDSENCNIIYENYISDENPATHQHNLSTRLQKYIKPFNPQSHFTINRENESADFTSQMHQLMPIMLQKIIYRKIISSIL